MKIKNSRWILRSAIGVVFLGAVACFFGFKFFNNNVEGISTEKPIPVAMALDDGYVYPTIVSITSMLENASPNRKLDFYVMHPGEFKDENKQRLKSLEGKYVNCSVNLINMQDKYKNAYDKGHITTPTYYRLSLSDLLPNIDKIIWLDGDTLTFCDLGEMYNLDMNGLYYRGFWDAYAGNAYTDKLDHYICAGVMIINLELLRKDNMTEKFDKFIADHPDKIDHHDQDVINFTCSEKIGKFPPKFGMFNRYNSPYLDSNNVGEYVDAFKLKERYTKEEMADGYDNIGVLHCVYKPWKYPDVPFRDVWWLYARKTDFYKEIKEKVV